MIYGRKYLNEENLLKDEIVLFSSEFTNEDVAYHDKKNGISIAVNATPNKKEGFYLKPYIKVYNSSEYSSATKVTRIYLGTGKLCYHSDRKKEWNDITNKELKYIRSCLDKETTSHEYAGMTVKDAIFKMIENKMNTTDVNRDVADKFVKVYESVKKGK